jgi:hypothetical protein
VSVAEKHAYNAESGAFPASCQQALDIIRALGDLGGVTGTLSELGNLQRIAGDYPGAAAILC